MIARGMKNKDIQFFFNRPDRAVNSGRITDIGKGTYSNSSDIFASSDELLDKFINNFGSVSTLDSEVSKFVESDPLEENLLRALFRKDDSGTWRFVAGESDEHECKSAYGAKHRGKWLRAIAALANNRGGYLLFGVHDKDAEKANGHDKSYELIGMTTTEFQDADPKDIFRYIKAVFDPTPRVRFGHGIIEGKTFGVIYVDRQQSKPVIARQGEGGGDIREGDIFFRYPGSSERIKYSDLRAIMDERDAQARSNILPMVERLLAIGPEKALVADLTAGVLTDGGKSIIIDEGLVQSLQFIKEGEFDEVEGAPTLRLLGDVATIESQKTIDAFGAVTAPMFFADFLSEKAPSHPKEYIKWAIEGGHANWLPIFWLAREAGLDRKGLAYFIANCDAPLPRKTSFEKRALGKETAFSKPKGPVATLCKGLSDELPGVPTAPNEAARICQAISGLTQMPTDRVGILKLLQKCQEIGKSNSSAMTYFRRAACRIDELLYAPN